MKATLTFNLDDLDQAKQHLRAIKATDMAIVLFDITRNLKKEVESKIDAEPDMTAHEVSDYIFDKIHLILKEQGVSVEELIN